MEAMASGKAVICSVIGGTPDMIESGEDGFLVKQRDADDIAAALRKLMSDHQGLVAMGKAARATAEKKFSHMSLAKLLRDQIFD